MQRWYIISGMSYRRESLEQRSAHLPHIPHQGRVRATDGTKSPSYIPVIVVVPTGEKPVDTKVLLEEIEFLGKEGRKARIFEKYGK